MIPESIIIQGSPSWTATYYCTQATNSTKWTCGIIGAGRDSLGSGMWLLVSQLGWYSLCDSNPWEQDAVWRL